MSDVIIKKQRDELIKYIAANCGIDEESLKSSIVLYGLDDGIAAWSQAKKLHDMLILYKKISDVEGGDNGV